MFHVHVINRFNRSSYQRELEEHHRIRHEIYVEERGWRDLARPDRREIDAFDTSDAIYLLGITAGRSVVAGSRLVPSLKPHLMSEVFPGLASGHVPRGQDIFEWTRFFVIPQLRAKGQSSEAAGRLYCSILEFCLDNQIRNLTIVCEAFWFERLAGLGWNPQLLGHPLQHDGMKIIGLIIDISMTALKNTRDAYRITGPVLASGQQRLTA